MKKVILLIGLLSLSGCASMNDAMTPSMKVVKDAFDGRMAVVQQPVSASSGLSEGWHTLGFEWSEKTPDAIYLTVGVSGVTNVTGVEFNADGKILSDISDASSITEYGDWSTRRFSIVWEDFLSISSANDVKMKVMQIGKYTISSFGPMNSGAVVNSKVGPFIEKVASLRDRDQ